MKVVIRGHEICGLIRDLAAEIARRGNDVTTIAHPHAFFQAKYDFDLYDLVAQTLGRRLGSARIGRRIAQLVWETSPGLHVRFERQYEQRLLNGADLYIQVWAGLRNDEVLYERLRAQGTRVAVLCMGSDVRVPDVFLRQYEVTRWAFPAEYRRVSFEERLRTLRRTERHADAIFSVPDQMGLALRPYHHLQVPIVLDRMTYDVSGRERPLVVHAPSVPHIKGTDLIESTLDTLRREGVDFEFRSVRNLPHAEVLALLRDADVLVDELIAHGPGWLSFEAMASGCAVATRYLEGSPDCFRPPVVAITEVTIYERLRRLLTDRALRMQLARAGRAYVETNNRVERVVDELIEKTFAGVDGRCDYAPTYLRDAYEPASSAEAELIARAEVEVVEESWYRPASLLPV